MKINLRKLILLPLLYLICHFGYAGGGPDVYGYTWLEDTDPGGPAYNWIEVRNLSGAVQVSGLADDNAVGPFNIGFNFPYYWNQYNSVKLGSNGWLSFDNVGNIASCFPNLPTAGGAGDNILAPLMSDLTFSTDFPSFPNIGEMWYWSNNSDSFIVEYVDVPFWANSNGGTTPPDWAGANTFQVILSASDSTITFQYSNTSPTSYWDSQACNDDVLIGIENVTGNIGLQSYNNLVPDSGSVIKFFAPATPLITVTDATPAWNANEDNAGQFYVTGSQVDLTANIANVGNGDITNDINALGKLENLSFSAIWRDTFTVNGLNQGATQTITYGTPVVLQDSGQYYYTVTTATGGGQDLNPSNNNNTVEISVVNCVNNSMSLTYSTGNAPDGVISWAGGGNNSGVGIFIDAPVLPATISSLDIFVVGDGDPQTPFPFGYTVQILEEDVNGNPGNILLADSIPPANIMDNDWNTVTLSSPVTISSGGFFVAFIQGGSDIGIGTEAFGPISQRTYEILAGGWAPYRQSTVSDFLIRANVDVTCPAVGVEEQITPFASLEAYPNPTSGMTKLGFSLKSTAETTLSIRDLQGRILKEENLGQLSPGEYQQNLNVAGWEAGIYFVTLRAGEQQMTRKLIVQ